MYTYVYVVVRTFQLHYLRGWSK